MQGRGQGEATTDRLTLAAVPRNYFNLPAWIGLHAGLFRAEGTDLTIDHIEGIAGLRGKRIGVSSLRAGSSSLIMKLLAQHGLHSPGDCELVACGPILARWDLLRSGGIDAGLQGAPLHRMALDQGFVSLAEPRDAFQFASLDVDTRWALASPLLLPGGIYGGVFTPAEAAAVSCVHALPVGLFVEWQLTLRALPGIFVNAMRTSAIVCAIIAVSAGFGSLVAQKQIATRFAAWLAATVSEKRLALAALNIAFFLMAAVMDEIAIMVIPGPMLIAIATRFGVDPIHFGAIIVTNVAIGMAISGLSLQRISRAIWPQILWMLVVLCLTTDIPGCALMFQPAAR